MVPIFFQKTMELLQITYALNFAKMHHVLFMLFHRGACKKFRVTCRRPELFAKITEDSFFVHAFQKRKKNSHFYEHFDFKKPKKKGWRTFRLEKQEAQRS
jgi:hypothetical protein